MKGPKLYVLVYVLLLGLLAATVLAARFELGVFNVVVALAIAALKMGLVLLYFMQLKDADRLDAMLLTGGFVMLLVVLIGLSLGDYLSRGWLPG